MIMFMTMIMILFVILIASITYIITFLHVSFVLFLFHWRARHVCMLEFSDMDIVALHSPEEQREGCQLGALMIAEW